MNPLFGIPSPASTTIKFPDSDLKKADFAPPSKNKALNHTLILIQAISLVPVRKTMRRSVRNLSRLLTRETLIGKPCTETGIHPG